MIPTLLVAASVFWLYAATLRGLVIEWLSSADASYGIVLAAVALVVLWRRREAFILASRTAGSPLPGGAALLAGLAVYLVGQLGADVFLTRVSFVLVLTGAVWCLAGTSAIRTVAAPLVFLLMAIPLPALLMNAVTLPLQLVASRIGEATLTAAGVAVFRDGNLLELPSTTLEVANACSGLRSIVSLAAIGGLLAWTESSWPRRVALVAATVPVAIVANGARVAGTGIAATWISPSTAEGFFHEFSGWVVFVVAFALMLGIQRLILLIAPPEPDAVAIDATAA